MKDDYILKDVMLNGRNILVAGLSKTNLPEILKAKIERKEAVFSATLIDINGDLILKKKKEFEDLDTHISLQSADLCDLAFMKDSSCDLIVLVSTLAALNERPLKALQGIAESKRVLKPEGTLIIKEKISTFGNNRGEFLFYNWYRSRKNMISNLFTENHKLFKAHFFLDDLRFAIRTVKMKIESEEMLPSEPISEADKKRLHDEFRKYQITRTPFYDSFIEMLETEYDEFKRKESFYPPNILMRCVHNNT